MRTGKVVPALTTIWLAATVCAASPPPAPPVLPQIPPGLLALAQAHSTQRILARTVLPTPAVNMPARIDWARYSGSP